MKIFDKSIIAVLLSLTFCAIALAIGFHSKVATKSPKAFLTERNLSDVRKDKRFKQKESSDKVLSADKLSIAFNSLKYDLAGVIKKGAFVPRIFLEKIPTDMSDIQRPKQKKEIFFKIVLPIILKANNKIITDRQRLLRIGIETNSLLGINALDKLWLAAMSDKYKTRRDDVSQLLLRVDIIPPSIALAQAAEESGWGTSRFAIEGNALFGQWTYGVSNSLIPLGRDLGKKHRVKVFPTIFDAVKAYMHNLNTHNAYREFRKKRENLRKKNLPLFSEKLLGSLKNYSQRRDEYIKTVRSIISSNQLDIFDNAKLGGDYVIIVQPPTI
ncbi:MAG: glucosaminidase domain-containing protein [Rhodospirillales bacterium]|nr:glucosaminidase domain-containing protein [Rhodospirillales bacterium]